MIVHNITNRTGTGRAYWVGGQKVRPGKFVDVLESALTAKDRALEGTVFFFGALLPMHLRTPAPTRVDGTRPPMSEKEVADYLAGLSQGDLFPLASAMVPPLPVTETTPANVLRARIGKAVFAGNRTLDPEAFFWLRRWTREGRTYLEKE